LTEDRALGQEIAALLPDLRAFARFLIRNPAAADDLVHDTVVRALAATDQFHPGTSLKAWLFTIQRNAFYEQARRAQRESAAMRTHADTVQGAVDAGAAAAADLARMIWRLPPRLREALVLVGAQQLTHEEAAAVCGVRPGTMRARLAEARARLAGPAAAEAG
jgi:RNA polymerase sigma factor (sigma-70 family)